MCEKEKFSAWKIRIKEKRETRVNGSPTTYVLDVFLANGFDDDQINWLDFVRFWIFFFNSFNFFSI